MTTPNIPGVHVTEWGSGPRVLMVHGGDPFGGASTFAEQQHLEARWHLIAPDRPGHGNSPRHGTEDFEAHAELLMPLLDDGPVHVLAHSYGGVVALYMAMQRPEAVLSLTLVESPTFAFAADDDVVEDWRRATVQLFQDPPENPMLAINTFMALVGFDMRLPEDMDPVPEFVLNMAQDLADIRPPNEAVLDIDIIGSGGYPILVITSGRTPAFEAIAAGTVKLFGAQHVVIPDTDHSVQKGVGVNDILERFWGSLTSSRSSGTIGS
jgi:pimeloyl-ACP methyl ester carboxylesterase